jgi:hypothetical protein
MGMLFKIVFKTKRCVLQGSAEDAIQFILVSHFFRILLSKGKIAQDLVAMLHSWRHSRFRVYAGPRILPREEETMEKLVRYIIRASFFWNKMTYLPKESKVVYGSKDGKDEKILDALE